MDLSADLSTIHAYHRVVVHQMITSNQSNGFSLINYGWIGLHVIKFGTGPTLIRVKYVCLC